MALLVKDKRSIAVAEFVPLLNAKQLVDQLGELLNDAVLKSWGKQESGLIKREEIVAWLQKEIKYDKETRFQAESLRAALLQDLHDSFFLDDDDHFNKKQDNPTTSWYSTAQFIYLAVVGTFLAICQGFDGIASILGSFSSVPIGLFFAAGFTFSLLSVGVFYVFDLVAISQQLGVTWGKSTRMLDVFLEQVDQIEKLRQVVEDCYANESADANADAIERRELQQLVAMLALRYSALDEARVFYLNALNNSPGVEFAKLVTTALTAVVFFGGGFFAGQTLALAVASLFMTVATATLWPVVATSAVAGLAALSLYCFIQSPVLANLVGHWFGLDKELINAFADNGIVNDHKQQLYKLGCKIAQLETLHIKITQLTTDDSSTSSQAPIPPIAAGAMFENRHVVSSCRDTIFNRKRSHSLGDIDEHAHAFVLQFV